MPVIDGPTADTPGAVCAWSLNTSCCPDWDTYTPEVQATAAAWATELLDALTGRRFAQCPVKLRPCGQRCGRYGGYLTFPVDSVTTAGAGNPWMIPFVDNGVWRNCGCAGACRCKATCEARMPWPVAEVLEVKLHGVVLDPSAYRIDNGNTLVLLSGGDECFPECQDLDVPDTVENTWSVTLRPGEPLPVAGAIAAGKLACEFAKACAGGGDCALPQELVSLSRNGVEVQVADPQLVLDAGRTGIHDVDLWVMSVNPARLHQRPRVHTPDLPPVRTVAL